MRSAAVLLTIILTVSSLFAVRLAPASAAIPKPSIPEFTVKFIDRPLDVPATHSVDPLTGANTTRPSYRIGNKTVELAIKNQPFTPYYEPRWLISLYFNVQVKEHNAENWLPLYSPAVVPLNPSNSDYTVLFFALTLSPSQPELGYYLECPDPADNSYTPRTGGFPSDGQMDFQVEAMIGYISRTPEFASEHFTGEESGWSDTQTLSLGTSSPFAIQPASVLVVSVAVVVFVAVATVGVLVYWKKRKR